MPISLTDDHSLLAVDVGATTTRAALFDVVEGGYRFLAVGQAPSTAEAPFKDIGLGVRAAIENIQSITGRAFLDADRKLISPSRADGSGVDLFTATLSAGPSIRTVIVGLLADVSLESARRLAETAYGRVVESLSLADRRRPDEQIDAILRARPDLIVLAGGTDGGASRSVHMMLDTAGLACYLMPKEKRPAILFAGNNSLADDVKRLLESLTPALHFSPNLRPSLDVEDLDPAMSELSQIVTGIRRGQLRGVDELEAWSNGHVFPTAYATGRMTRFLSRLTGASGGVLSVTLGASAASVAAGFNGDLCLRVYPQYGLGENLAALAQNTDPDELIRWLSLDIHQNSVRDAIYQRSLYPSTVPATPEERAISQALARHTLHLAVRAAQRDFPPAARSDLLPAFEFIFASGAALTDGATPGQNLLLLLDALQPTGVTQAMLDRNNLLPLLGAAADLNQLLPVQALESGAFLNLGTTVSVVSAASHGAPVLRARLRYADRNEANIEVKRGALELLPLGAGETAKLTLQPLHRADVGFGPGRGQTITVHGGALGLVIDARGRPLQLPSDAVRRRELFKKWLWTLGG